MSTNPSWKSPLGMCILPPRPRNAPRTVSYASYMREILAHAGVCYTPLSLEQLENHLPHTRILLTVGDTPLPETVREAVRVWVQHGGAWLAIGGTAGAPGLFGVEEEPATYSGWGAAIGTLGEGYLLPAQQNHPVLSSIPVPLHFFNGTPVRARGGRPLAGILDAHQRETARAGVVEHLVGEGRCLLIAPDVTGTTVRIQQGVAVTRDGVAAPDGTAPICDQMLKTGDGAVLDWLFDRQPLEGVSGFSAFLQPVADIWRTVVVRSILYLAHLQNVVLPILWLYPRNLPALAHLSHDTDGNDPALGERMLDVVRQAGISSTWCIIPPGYPQSLIERIRAEGHELAMHFDAVEEGSIWDEGAFHEQWRTLKNLFGGEPPVSNKNHYLRWEGDTEFFEWCQRRGIQIDQSKGPSKTGEAGFNFGTCHPYFPVDPQGQWIDVLELPTLTQDLNVFAPDALLDPLLQAVLRHHGILHLLFHPAHVGKPGIAETILHAVRRAQECGMEWWTACQISRWERARRTVQWLEYRQQEGETSVRVGCDTPLEEATILISTGSGAVDVDVEGLLHTERTERWGFPMTAVTLGLHAEVTLKVSRKE